MNGLLEFSQAPYSLTLSGPKFPSCDVSPILGFPKRRSLVKLLRL